MAIEIGARPAGLNGCWKTWKEQDVDVVIRTDMDAGNVKTRRRFTGISRSVTASVTLPHALLGLFHTWWRVNQRQGAIATRVMTPEGTEEVFQWSAPPTISISVDGTFTANVTMYQGSWF